MMKKVLSRGNNKLHNSIFCWAITPVESCLNCSQCAKRCYARFPYRMRPNVRKAWDFNFSIAKTGAFVDHIIEQLSNARTCKSVRIHVAGDFFSPEYIEGWKKIVDFFPAIRFYSYSKVFDILPGVAELASRNNCNIINSITPDGGVNFGDNDRIAGLVELGYKVCPAARSNDITCGLDCTLCLTESKVCFNVHR